MENNKLMTFVKDVCREAGFDSKTVNVLDYDLDRIYLAVDSESNNYNIRTWNIRDNAIRYSLFELVEDCGKTIIKSKNYFIN